jgi:serine protease
VRALGRFGGSSIDIIKSICYSAGLSDGPNCNDVPQNLKPADVINMSLGGSGFSALEQAVVSEATQAGSIIVAAAGNGSSSEAFYPAAYEDVIAVSAITLEREIAPYSNFGAHIDVAAPGGDTSADINGDGYGDGVLSTGGNDSLGTAEYVYPFFQGTSMAAPHVAGVIALMKSVNDDLTPADIDALLVQGKLTDVEERTDELGLGIINAQKAVSAALQADGNPPADAPWLGVTPQALNFGATLGSLNFTLRNNAGGELQILQIVSDQPWLIAPAPQGVGDYALQVNREGLEDGTYSGQVTITSDVNTEVLSVIMQVSRKAQTGNAGLLHIRLVDALTGNIRDTKVAVENGRYDWRIKNLPPGQYELFAFTDSDNDDQVCDPGEACGAYLTTDQPVVIDLLDANISVSAAL